MYRGNVYPTAYHNRYFFGNFGFGFGSGNIYTSDLDGNYQQFGQTGQFSGLVDMQVASDGQVWILSVVNGSIQRLVFDGDNVQPNRDPMAVASASQTAGVGPLSVVLSSGDSTDADNDSLLSVWDFESDGIVDAIGSSISHDYAEPGRTTSTLITSDGRGGTDTALVEIDIVDAVPTNGNLAFGRPASQQGATDGGLASRAVDGIIDGAFDNDSVSQTSQVRKPLRQTDLGQSYNISEIDVYRRTDPGTAAQLSNFWVLVSESPFSSSNLDAVRVEPGVDAFHFPGSASDLESFTIDVPGRYVRIQLAGESDILSLAEVQVFE